MYRFAVFVPVLGVVIFMIVRNVVFVGMCCCLWGVSVSLLVAVFRGIWTLVLRLVGSFMFMFLYMQYGSLTCFLTPPLSVVVVFSVALHSFPNTATQLPG